MNAHPKTHGTLMLIGGAGVALLAVVVGVGWQQAVTWGVLLACPLGMLGMMWFMGRQSAGGHQHGVEPADGALASRREASGVPTQRVSDPAAPEG